LPGSPSGAQRASRKLRIALALTTAGLAAVTIAPIATAAGPLTDGQSRGIASASDSTGSPTQLTTTATSDAPWLSYEKFAFFLVNCTRTGGWVLSDGTCRGYGSGRYSSYVRPLSYGPNLSTKVARPYSKLLATRNVCSHYADHDLGYRLRRAGYRPSYWGENIGCGSGYSSVKAAVLAFHRMMQAEKSSSGGHWKNMKNRYYIYLGVGVWKYGSRYRLVEDFFRPS
jgi:hypothetical protein